ncbi:Hypothetical predicted protein [Paramuricea clavata]|uniref:Uncharacterized protein n=1 Tax=Paramuricea clavata TaxID=317549 RepID=A0A7D9JT04_PARCT|nr:Hypothetical predicted protein [Paramuricea clavata]
MDEGIDEELEMAFELGFIKGSLKRRKLIKQLQRDDYNKREYFLFKTLASKLGIDLPDQPPEETTAEDEIDQFYSNQVTHVQNYLLEYKTNHVEKIFSIGDQVEKLLIIISKYDEVFGKNESLLNQNVQRLPKLVKKLEIMAKSLGIDISEELSKVNDHEKLDEDDINILKLQLKTKLCKRANEPTEMNTKRSEVDPTRMITDDYWAISLVRLPGASHSQHAFLVLEGITGNKSMIWLVEFVANHAFDLFRLGINEGKLRLDYYESSTKSSSQCHKKLIEICKGGRWLHETWYITKGTAQKLIQCIDEWRMRPPEFNPFTLARMMVHDLNDENIEIPELEDTLEEWIFSIQYNNKWWKLSRFSLMFTFVAGSVIAYSFLKLW